MKAVLDRDIILWITERGDTEIGSIPKGVGPERLRFNGTNVVDLADLSSIWVKHLGANSFELHAIEVPGSQKVTMTYQDRKNLVMDNGTIRLKTVTEITAEKEIQKNSMIKNRLRQAFKRDVGDPEDSLADAWKIIALLIIYMRTGEPTIATFLDAIIPDLQAAYPFTKVKDALVENTKTIKTLMEGYYQELNKK